METKKNLWWAYLYVNGSVQVKRYFNDGDIAEARESPFCDIVIGAFPAIDRDDATELAIKQIKNLLI